MTAELNPGAFVISNDSCSDAGWDEFLANCPGGHHEQSSLWGDVKRRYGWIPQRVTLTREGRILGGFQILTRRFGRLLRIGYICKGPVVATWDTETTEACVTAVDSYARRNRISYLVADLPYNGHSLVDSLQKIGFVPHPNHLPPTTVMKATTIVDLRPELSAILAGMTTNARRNIRRSEQEGVTVREGSINDVPIFRELMLQLCARLKTGPTPPEPDFFENLFRIFSPKGHVSLFLAQYQNSIVSAAIVFFFGETARLWKVGWSGEGAKARPNNALWWGAMKRAKERGSKFFDLVGVDDKIAKQVLAGKVLSKEEAGSAHFKLGFGGDVILLPGQYTRFYNPLLGMIGSESGAAILSSRPARFARRVARMLGAGASK